MKFHYCESCRQMLLGKFVVIRNKLSHLTHNIIQLEYDGT